MPFIISSKSEAGGGYGYITDFHAIEGPLNGQITIAWSGLSCTSTNSCASYGNRPTYYIGLGFGTYRNVSFQVNELTVPALDGGVPGASCSTTGNSCVFSNLPMDVGRTYCFVGIAAAYGNISPNGVNAWGCKASSDVVSVLG
jgi:hypothetical protein